MESQTYESGKNKVNGQCHDNKRKTIKDRVISIYFVPCLKFTQMQFI